MNVLRIPSDLAFLVRVDSLKPDYEVQENRARHHPQGFWAPPNVRNAYIRTNGPLFRWRGGRMALVGDPVLESCIQPQSQYSAATVFTQIPDTGHLLAVDFDAETRDVRDALGGWRVLSFNHVPSGPNNHNGTYSYLDLFGAEQHLAAPGSATWLPQLMPPIYNYQEVTTSGHPVPSRTQSSGLIGSLPLLLALAAFSAPPDSLAEAFASVQPGMWRPHTLPLGRSE